MSTTHSSGVVPLPTATPTADAVPSGDKDKKKSEQEKALKLFTLDTAPPTYTARVFLPSILPGHEPFVFVLRLTFSETMQKKRDAFLALAPTKQVEVEDDEIVNEMCDLLAQDPTGFGDYEGNAIHTASMAPAVKLRNYYNRAKNHSDHAHAIVKMILRAANNLYWGAATPREFLPPTTNNSAGESEARQANSE